MRIGYGYRRREKDLREAGAEKVYIDMDRLREHRADMMKAGLREGDTLLLLSLRDLGGAPNADQAWRRKVEAAGVSIEIVEKSAGRVGRPAEVKLTDEQTATVRRIWLDGDMTERARLQAIASAIGVEMTRSMLNGRFGWPSKPKT